MTKFYRHRLLYWFSCVSVFLIIGLAGRNVKAQQLPEIFSTILERDTSYTQISCKINIQVHLPGLHMPDKEVNLFMSKTEETRIDGEGLMLLPRRGVLGQYKSIIETPCQAIPLKDTEDTLVYKLVSLDPESDWITVDFTISKADALVHKLGVVTRDNGVFNIQHVYGQEHLNIPIQSVISFEALPMKLPLRFIAQNNETDQIFNGDEPIDGKVILSYSEIEVLK